MALDPVRSRLLAELAEPASAATLAGRVGDTVEEILENDHMRSVTVRLDAPTPGVASLGTYNCGGPIQVCLSLYLYGDRAAAAITRDQPLWQQWMSERFPAETPA